MRMYDFDSYMKHNTKPVLGNEAFDAKIKSTLNSLPTQTNRCSFHKRAGVFAFNVLVLVAVLVFLLPGSEAILSTEWLYAHPSEDNHQYIIEGVAFEPEIVERADADDSEQWVTASYEEVCTFFDCDLRIPHTILSTWTIEHYVCANTFTGKELKAFFQNSDIEHVKLVYSMSWIKNPEETMSWYEEMVNDGDGWFKNVMDHRVHVQGSGSKNDSYSYKWIDGNCAFGLNGPLSLSEMDQVASELMSIFDGLPIEVQNKWIPEEIIEPITVLQADNVQEIRDRLGSSFMLPMVQIDGWKPIDFYGVVEGENIREALVFYEPENGDEGTIIVEKKVYTGFEDFYVSFEQNEMGEVIRYGDLEIYVAYNHDYILTICLRDQCMYVVTGAINLDKAKQVYDKLMDLEKQNSN